MERIKEKHVLLKHKNFLYLFIGRFISAVGDKVFTIALAVWIISSGQEDAKLHLGLLLAMNALPIVLFGPIAGTLADRFNRKSCMLVADALRFAILAITLLLLVNDKLGIPQMYVVSFMLAVFVPLFESAANASISHLVSESDLPRAIAVDSSVISMSQILGASLGGLLVATIHFQGALIFNALTYLVSFFFVSMISKRLVFENERESYLLEIVEGFSYVFKNKPLRMLLMIFGFLNFFTASIFILIPFLVQYTFNLPVAHWIGIYEVSFAVGAGLTAIFLSFVKSYDRIYLKMSTSLALFGCSFIGIGLMTNHWFVIPLLLLAGSGLAVVNTLALGLFQHTVADAMKGRFFAILGSVALSVIPVSYIVTGYISAFISSGMLFIIYGAMITILALVLYSLPRIQDKIGN